MLIRFRRDERAATAIEYGLVASLIALAILAGASAIGTTLQTQYYKPVADSLK